MAPATSLEMTVGTSWLTCDPRRNYESYYSEGKLLNIHVIIIFMRSINIHEHVFVVVFLRRFAYYYTVYISTYQNILKI